MKSESVKKISGTMSIAAFVVVLIFGIVFSVFAVILANQKIPENYVETTATITRIENELLPGHDPADVTDEEIFDHHVFVTYSYNGQSFDEAEYGNYSSSMKEGDSVLLYLNPDNPEEFFCDPSGKIVFVIIGIGIVLVGIGGIVYNIVKKKKEAF